MKDLTGKIAVVTGGGTGMGRELVIQLAAAGAHVATCDVIADNMAETTRRAREVAASSDTRITSHVCDVSDAVAMDLFRDEVRDQHDTTFVNLVFNNAGIGGGGSFVNGSRTEWERTFGVCWGGVYNGCRAFVPMLVASEEGYLVNTSSVNGFWASLGPGVPHTAYSAAKFAVKGFTEALMEDFRVNAPHVNAAVVMPGHIGTDIAINTRLLQGGSPADEMTAEELDAMRAVVAQRGVLPADQLTDDVLRGIVKMMGEGFRDNAPLTAAQAATIILDGVRAGAWRILVGDDAHALDEAVRADPLGAYGPDGISLATVMGALRQ
ncbi:MAG TPA: SDR family NAD(P)-dependent oxidoreductase [Acidimicrobiales bacterium]|nr:SDR family NAD(P)-dependent oxidoreductase [Acidimicrobiales bacterium]